MRFFNNIINFYFRTFNYPKANDYNKNISRALRIIKKLDKDKSLKLAFFDNFFYLDQWQIFSEDLWGSAALAPDISVKTPQCIELNYGSVDLFTKHMPNGIEGRRWNGDKEIRYFASADMSTLQSFYPRGWFVLEFEILSTGRGGWESFWIMKTGNGDIKYEEFDFFENRNKFEITSHGGSGKTELPDGTKLPGRKMYNYKYPKITADGRKHWVIANITDSCFKVWLDGCLIFKTKKYIPQANAEIILSTALDDFSATLPYKIRIHLVKFYKTI